MTIPLSKLLKVASKSDHKKNLHATLIFRGSALLSAGYNHNGIHAEEVAVKKIWPNKRRGTHCVNIMITRKMSKMGNSKPCEECRVLLEQAGISKITYYDGSEFISERV